LSEKCKKNINKQCDRTFSSKIEFINKIINYFRQFEKGITVRVAIFILELRFCPHSKQKGKLEETWNEYWRQQIHIG